MFAKILHATTIILLSVTLASAEEPLLDDLRDRFQSEALTLGALVQVVGTYDTGDSVAIKSGFSIANFRVSLKGQLDEGWGYFLQTSFTKGPALLDANVRYRRWNELAFTAGAFKAPFSAEFLTGAASIDFVNRSQVVTRLTPGRQVGLAARGVFEPGFGYVLAAFNGNGIELENDDDRLMGSGRLTYDRTFDDARVRAGVHGYYSQDTNVPVGLPIAGAFVPGRFSGERTGYGADARLSWREWLLAGEYIGSRFDPIGGMRVNPDGYFVTAGFMPTDDSQLLVRWDSFVGDGTVADSDLVVAGVNYWPTSASEVQVNAVIPTESGRDVQLLVNVQVGF